jgi:hypothetical protein
MPSSNSHLFHDVDYNGYGGKAAPPVEPEAEPANVWEHKLGDTMPEPARFPDGSADEARLSGSFNDTLTPDPLQALLAEARRVLLTGDDGAVYRRGETVVVTEPTWKALRHGPAAARFAFLGG